MATLAMGNVMTLAEIVNRETPDGKQADLVDVLNQTNRITGDATWLECNNGSYYEDTLVSTEPTGNTRAYDMGVVSEAGTTEKVTEPTEMLDGHSTVDVAKARHAAGGSAGFRMQEDGIYLRGMTKTFVNRLFDSNRGTSPLQINGINNRANYNDLDSDYVYDNAQGNASVTANKTSIYIIQWGPKMVNLIYPRGDVPGSSISGESPVRMQDYGEQMTVDPNASTKMLPKWNTWFEIHFGLFIHDPRMVKRICNISTSNIDGVDDFSINEDLLIDATNDLENNGMGAIAYTSRTVFAQLQKRSNEKGNAYFVETRGEGPFAHKVIIWDGMPIHRVDQISSTQATVTT